MKTSSSDVTRQKLLDAATEIFSEAGYKAATVREIVRRANVNQAAINYHFRGKDALYHAVMHQAFARAIPMREETAATNLTPEQEVRALVSSLLSFNAAKDDPYATFKKLLAWEMVEPSGMLEPFQKDAPVKHHAMVMNIVRRFLPQGAPEHHVAWAAFWLVEQCMMIRQAQNIIRQMPPELAKALDDNRPALPDFLSLLALNGLKNSS